MHIRIFLAIWYNLCGGMYALSSMDRTDVSDYQVAGSTSTRRILPSSPIAKLLSYKIAFGKEHEEEK